MEPVVLKFGNFHSTDGGHQPAVTFLLSNKLKAYKRIALAVKWNLLISEKK